MPQSTTPTRRQFLATAAAITAPMIIPSSALGLDGAVAPSERITVGCIGTGGRGMNNLAAFKAKPELQIVAVCDVDKAHRAQAADLAGLGEEASYNDYREVLARADIDAVSIATPDHWHALNTIDAANAGKDIFCEKPISLTVTQGRKMADAVAKNQRMLQAGTWRRSSPACRQACELVRNGYIGELQAVECGVPEGYSIQGEFKPGYPAEPVPEGFDYELWLGPAPQKPYTPARCHFNFRWILDYGAGYITDWGAHYYDIAQWGAGMDDTGPVRISGAAEFPRKGELFDASVKHLIEYEYANGVRIIALSTSDAKRYGIKFIGSEGWLHVESTAITSSIPGIDQIALKDTDIRLYKSDDHVQDFVNCVKSRQLPTAPIEIAHRTASICHLGHIATTLKRELNWDPAKEEFKGDDEANALRDRPMRGDWKI